jgi:hypothetical protein
MSRLSPIDGAVRPLERSNMPRFLSEEVIEGCFQLADTQTEELFGDRQNLPKDEFAIVFDWSLTHEAKVQKLKAIRAAKRNRVRRALSNPSKADKKWAGEMGIRLD